jgi:hypothetical protein
MIPHHDDLIGDWTGLIVHKKAATKVKVDIKGIQEDGSLYGSYSFPKSDPPEDGGDFTGELFDPWLFIKLKDNKKVRFHVHITGEKRPEMMYGAIPSANGKTPHATITLFPAKEQPSDWPFFGLWQDFFLEGL